MGKISPDVSAGIAYGGHRKTYGALMSNAVLKAKLQGMMEEVVAVARARKVYLPGNAVDRTMEMAGRFASDAKTSMQLDKEKGRQTEVDTLTGFLCRAGRESEFPPRCTMKFISRFSDDFLPINIFAFISYIIDKTFVFVIGN